MPRSFLESRSWPGPVSPEASVERARDRRGERPLVMVLAGGMGERLFPITADRAKPVVPFGGNFRIIDFTLNNCVMSGLRRIYVLTQYHGLSLNRHLRERWSYLPREVGEFVEAVPSKLRTPSGLYRGTADAIFRNLDIIEEDRPEEILVLSGDHIYRADYDALVRRHSESGADATVLSGSVPAAEATQFGVMHFGADGRIEEFIEKPADPKPHADALGRCPINLGVYCFNTRFLVQQLVADAKRKTAHDIGRDILPAAVKSSRVHAQPLEEITPGGVPYWRDVGSIDSLFAASMDLLTSPPGFDLRDPRWPEGSRFEELLPARVESQVGSSGASLFSPSAQVGRAHLDRAILSPRVKVEDGAILEEAILFEGVRVGRDARLRRVVVEEGVCIPPGASVGFGEPDIQVRTPAGVLVVARGHPIAEVESGAA